MNLVSTRRVGLGVAGALAGAARDVANAAATGWPTPLAAPVRSLARALIEAAETRGARVESRLLSEGAQASSDWFGRAPRCWTTHSAR